MPTIATKKSPALLFVWTPPRLSWWCLFGYLAFKMLLFTEQMILFGMVLILINIALVSVLAVIAEIYPATNGLFCVIAAGLAWCNAKIILNWILWKTGKTRSKRAWLVVCLKNKRDCAFIAASPQGPSVGIMVRWITLFPIAKEAVTKKLILFGLANSATLERETATRLLRSGKSLFALNHSGVRLNSSTAAEHCFFEQCSSGINTIYLNSVQQGYVITYFIYL